MVSAHSWRRSHAYVLLATILVVAAADFFFYRHAIGWTAAALTAVMFTLLAVRDDRFLGSVGGRVLTLATLVCCSHSSSSRRGSTFPIRIRQGASTHRPRRFSRIPPATRFSKATFAPVCTASPTAGSAELTTTPTGRDAGRLPRAL